jgi:Flp pilus assembly pilin Flp
MVGFHSVSLTLALLEDDSGQNITEYAVVMAVVLVVVVTSLAGISSETLEILRRVVAALR